MCRFKPTFFFFLTIRQCLRYSTTLINDFTGTVVAVALKLGAETANIEEFSRAYTKLL